jgi:hypothetical protein
MAGSSTTLSAAIAVHPADAGGVHAATVYSVKQVTS